MTGGQREQHLTALREELARRGVRCELATQGVYPRLRIYCPGEGASAGFDHNVVAAPVAGRWFFFWPWAEPVGSVTRLAEAAARIIADLDLDLDLDWTWTSAAAPATTALATAAPGRPCRPWLCRGCCGKPGQGSSARPYRARRPAAPDGPAICARPLGEVARVPPWKRRRP